MKRDYETKGALLIKTVLGVVSATEANFTLTVEEMSTKDEWREAVKAETGVFCLVPSELNIPF